MDPYSILHVLPNADNDVIKASFKALSRKYEDDTARLQLVRQANDAIGTPAKRSAFDAKRQQDHKGKVIEGYRLLEKIAEGGFGVTYKAECIISGTMYCIKQATNITPEDEQLLIAEAKSLNRLRHYGIPSVLKVMRLPDDSLALVMSYIPGPTLAQLREKHTNGIEAEHVAWITERVLNILKYLHMHGVVHGDVKPQNIIVQPKTHEVVLVDYGLSMIKPSSKDGAKGYTPHFAAPEQVDGKPPIPETDLYGLGMTMVYALGGEVEYFRIPSTVPDNMVVFIKRLIKRDALQRPRIWDMVDLCEDIKQVRSKDFGRTASGMKPLHF